MNPLSKMLLMLLLGGCGSSRMSGCFAQTYDTIIAQFPSEGRDYVNDDIRGHIFDMSRIDGVVRLTNEIEVPRPFNIGNVQPSSRLDFTHSSRTYSKVSELSQSNAHRASLQWGASGSYQTKLSGLASSRGLSLGTNSPLKPFGFEVGFSQNSEYRWAQTQLESVDGYVVETRADYDYVEVFMKPITAAELNPDFLQAFAVLPIPISSDPWAVSLSEGDQRRYETFLNIYGTHYVEAAKFGGSFTSRVLAQQCQLVIERQTSTSLESCLLARVNAGIGDGLGLFDVNLFEAKLCNGFTADGTSRSRWNSSIEKSTETWEGGSLRVAPNLQKGDGNFSSWIVDVQRNPRSVPTRLSSLPDLFRDISGAYDLADDFCLPCQWLKNAGLNKEAVNERINYLEGAFVEYLYKALVEKTTSESVCNSKCGRCQLAPPNDDCTCPEADLESCEIEAPEVMKVEISTIEFAVDFMPGGKRMLMKVSNLGDPYDAKDISTGGSKRRISYTVDASFLRQPGDYIRVQVYRYSLPACIGLVDFPVEKVGTGEELKMTASCSSNHYARKGKNPRVIINGRVSFPYCCNCTAYESYDERPSSAGLLHWWEILLVVVGVLLFCCCCCKVCSECGKEES